MNLTNLGIIILNWNQSEDVINCINTISGWSQLHSTIWIVDNGSTIEHQQHLKASHIDANIIWGATNLGFAGGNNLGIQAALDAGCQEILLLNNDAFINEPDMLHLLQSLHTNTNIGAIGPTLWDAAAPEQLLSAGGSDIGLTLVSHQKTMPSANELRNVAYIPGTCALFRRESFEMIGLLDEAYFFGGEVADLCMGMQQQGYRCVIDGGARAYHEIDRSSQVRHGLHIYYVLRNRFLYIRKYHKNRQGRLFLRWTLHSIRPFLESIIKGEWQRARSIFLACLDGWMGRFGGQNQRLTRGKTT
ncbi:MAG: glycosyltransferase family 2 protein [Chloroflexi bacterium]|nr:glycosyltransferase family 2 protein [Chloroflexota bacterium]